MKSGLIWLGLFGWLIVPAAIYVGVQTFGLPHTIWSYDYHASRSEWNKRSFTRCTFVGPYGTFARDAVDGKCPWLAFIKSREAAQ
jgi:hypothetical protein